MRVRFYIERRRGEDGRLLTIRRPIIMTVAFYGKRVLISTGKNVDLQWWDPDKQLVKEIYPDAGAINGWLKTLEFTASAAWKALASLSEKPGVSDFRETFEKLRPRFSGGFFDVMFLFMEEGSRRWSSSTYKKVRTFYDQLRIFEKEDSYIVSFKTINEEFLIRFLSNQRKQEKAEMTILKNVNTLVWFLNWATDEGYNIYSTYRRFYSMLNQHQDQLKKSSVYLEWVELMQFFNYSAGDTKIERVRDIFCLMCFTGISFSELRNLKKEDVTERFLIIGTRKGSKRQVPFNKYSKAILDRYANRYYRDNSALPPLSMVTINKYLRIIAGELGLTRRVKVPKIEGGMLPLMKIITAGVAVQTFIMNSLQLDIPPEVISAFTGVNKDQRVRLLKQEIANREMEKFNNIQPQ